MLDPNLGTCQLAAWAKNAVKFELKLSNKNGGKNQTKMRWSGVGDTIKMTRNVGCVNEN